MFKVWQIKAGEGCILISRIICLGFLLGLSVMDIQFRRLPQSLLAMGSVLAAIYCVWCKEIPAAVCAGGIGLGILFMCISWLTREGIGYGDSWIICILGAYLGVWKLLSMLAAALTALLMAAGAVLIIKKWNRKVSLPAIPFFTAGYIVLFAAERMA